MVELVTSVKFHLFQKSFIRIKACRIFPSNEKVTNFLTIANVVIIKPFFLSLDQSWRKKKAEKIRVFSDGHFVYGTDLTCYTYLWYSILSYSDRLTLHTYASFQS